MRGKISDAARIQHIFEYIKEIEIAVKKEDFESFYRNHMLRIGVVKCLEIVGEAANHISEETKQKYKNIEWRKIIGMRNFVIHEYFEINYEIIWDAATVFVQELKTELQAINIE